jgi:hypothetical protein
MFPGFKLGLFVCYEINVLRSNQNLLSCIIFVLTKSIYFFYVSKHKLNRCTQWTNKDGKAVPLQAWSGPEVSRKLRFPDFMTMAQDGGKVVSLTHRPPLPPGNTPGTHFCYRLSRPQGHSATGRIMSLKNSNDTIGNRARDLPVCSVVP